MNKLKKSLLLLFALFALGIGAKAQGTKFITDVMLVAVEDGQVESSLAPYTANGWFYRPATTGSEYYSSCVNWGCTSNSNHVIMLLYKTSEHSSSPTPLPVTGFYIHVSDENDSPEVIHTYYYTYHRVPCEGPVDFVNSHGDVNWHCGGKFIHLYYTKEVMTPGDGINDIQIWKDNSSYAVGANGTNEPANLNQGTNPGHVIYMRPIHTNITVDPTNINVSTAVDLHGALTYGNANVTMVDDITLSSIVRINFTDNLHDNVATLDLNGHTLDRGLSGLINVDQYGGVFHIWFGTMIVNDASGDNSGVIKGAYSTAGAIWNLSTFIFNGGTITENRSSYLGGGIYSYLNTEVIINGGVITNNSAADHGGAIYNEGSLTISNCTITNNSAADHAGAIYNAGNLTISNCTINENTANDVGGIYNANIDNQYFGHATLTNCTLIDNSSSTSAGALANALGATEMTLNNCTVQSNTANTNGGGIWNGGTLTINGGDISYNTCYGTVGADGGEYNGKGGGIYHNGVALNMVGNPVVTRNIGVSNTENNLYLDNNKVITVTEAFTQGASIGLSASNNDATLTSGYSTYNPNTPPDIVFFSDKRYGIVLVDNEVKFDTDANLIIFTTSGNWNDPNRWNTGTVPTSTDNVYVFAAATIPANYVAQVNRLILGNRGSITIADGGQLKHSNEGVEATVKKNIAPYSGDGGYYLITNPTLVEQYPDTLGMISNNHDLYMFDQTEELEWRNYGLEAFNMLNGMGYLYANDHTKTLAFNGELKPASTDIAVPLAYDVNADFAGFNLVGNPFVCNAYLLDENNEIMPFFRLNDTGDAIVAAQPGTAIKPCEGVFVICPNDGQAHSAVFTTTAPANTGEAQDAPAMLLPVHDLLAHQDASPVGGTTQTISLSQGWNWFSTYIELDDPVELLEMLQNALGDNATVISASEMYTEYYGNGFWIGDLNEVGITNEQMYMVEIVNDCEIELEGAVANPADHAITIYPGWNWIGFPSSEELSLEDALADFEAEEGDVFSEPELYTEYGFGMWIGDVATLVPGRGYMYYSNSTQPKTLVFPSTSKGKNVFLRKRK